MMYTKDQARAHIADLVAQFEQNEATLLKTEEANIENVFVRPLFRYLNWNVDNTGLSEPQWEFVLQRTTREGSRPDYILQLDGQHLFVMDAKKARYDMHDPRWLNQVYAYAYSTQNNAPARKIDFAILTDFQEFVVLDCTLHATRPETLNNFRVLDWRYPDYVSHFDELWDLFERNNVLAARRGVLSNAPTGIFTRYLSPKQVKANRIPPDKAFLAALDDEKTGWRVRLAKDMKRLNPQATGDVLTAAVQLLIDRLVFVKVLSDREIEEDYLAKMAAIVARDGLAENDRGWFVACQNLFADLNQMYNGSVFAPRPELEAVAVSNKVVRDIIDDLLPENSPYNFAVLPVEILGTIYERFLGRVVHATDARVKIEDKPEVRKAGGVYYTPQYIVNYIAQNTVGKLLADCKTPADVARLKILDPACGSGSFLLGAYDALIAWHKAYYATEDGRPTTDEKNRRPSSVIRRSSDAYYLDDDGRVRLTAKLKRQILLNNLFGVDIDPQAVEVTRLSLSLKALEETRRDEAHHERTLFNQTLLPDLTRNIKCGNSLIGTDYICVDDEELKRVKPFDWAAEFPQVFTPTPTLPRSQPQRTGEGAAFPPLSENFPTGEGKGGGFDAVIGNPPWGAEIHGSERGHLTKIYPDVADFESSQYFLVKSIALLGRNGLLGMIIPNTFALNIFARKCREKILDETAVSIMVDLSDADVFAGPSVRSMILVAEQNNISDCQVFDFRMNPPHAERMRKISQDDLKKNQTWKEFFVKESPIMRLMERLIMRSNVLADFCDVKQGYIPYRTTTLTRRFGRAKAEEIVKQRSWHSVRRESAEYKKELQGRDVGRYSLEWSGIWVRYGEWVSTYLPLSVFSGSRILIREITGRLPHALLSTYVEDVFVHNPSVLAVLPRSNNISPKFILGVLNSRLTSLLFSHVAPKAKKGLFPKIIITDAKRLPFPRINFADAADKSRHDRLVALVDQMLDLHKRLHAAQTQTDRELYQRQIDATDKQIDALVYELYGLTEEEIKIVEGK